MNLVDSCGWLEFLEDGSNYEFFLPSISNTQNLLVPTICVFEVFKLTRLKKGAKAAFEIMGHMRRGQIVELDTFLAQSAATISLETKLAMADSIIIATARIYDAQVWTQDAHFEGIPNVRYNPKS